MKLSRVSLAVAVALLVSSVAMAQVPDAAQPEKVISYEIGGLANIPAPSCRKNSHGFVLVSTGSPSPHWPVQIQVKGSGPWTIRLLDGRGMQDMTATADVDVYCVPNR